MKKSQKELLNWYLDLGVEYFLEENLLSKYSSHDSNYDNSVTTKINECNILSKDLSRKLATKCFSLKELKEEIEKFDKIDLKKGATNVVFADGNPTSDFMLIGEAPGINEDKYGIPFCGLSGKLLDNILSSIYLNRSNYYITNTVFWRPPGNRRPTSEEIDICRPFVEKHISLVRPKVIILVGSTAVESLLSLKTPMAHIRKQNFKYTNQYLSNEIDTFVIFHPSYLLRQPSKKKLMWEDIQRIYSFYKKI